MNTISTVLVVMAAESDDITWPEAAVLISAFATFAFMIWVILK